MKTFSFYIFLLAMCAAVMPCLISHAKEQEKTFQERVPKELIEQDYKFITATIENDSLGSGTDENYTNGLRITYHDTAATLPKISEVIEKILPFFDINDTSSVYYSIGQNLYTPNDITTKIPDPTDRPYAGFLYGSVGFNTLSKNHIDEIELTLGVIGPSSLGEQAQELVHDSFDLTHPSGWDSQLKDEPALIFAFQRQWPEAYAHEFDGLHFRVAPHVGLALGNVYTYAASGVTFQLTPSAYKWQSTPLRVRPAMPGSGYFAVPKNHFAWSLFSGIEGRAMAQNIFLDGNTFRDGPSVDKKHFVADANVGFSLTYGNIQTAYTLNWRSREFNGQENSSLFGALSVGYRF